MSRTAILFGVLAVLVAGCGESRGDDRDEPGTKRPDPAVKADPVPDASPAEDGAGEAQAPDPAADLPLSVLAGELVMTKLVGTTATSEELEAVRRLQVGGIILFGPSVQDEAQLRALLQSLNAERDGPARRAGLVPGLLVSIDQEGGPIRNVPFAPPELSQPALAGRDQGVTRSMTKDTGAVLSELGINMDLGPVADLAQSPNRTMAGRSFGSDPAFVARYVEQSVRGLEEGGVAAVAKHFPGFGASTANSDEAVAYVDRTRAQLLAEELVPFRAAIDAGVDAVMVSHGIHRLLGSTRPGTLDPRIATDLLRTELGYTGVAMTDSMNARGLREAWGDTVPRACPVAIAAGIDMMLLTGTIETARLCRQRILDAVADGTLEESRVREAAGRVLALRRRVA